MRDSTSVKRHTSAGGKEGKLLLVVDFSIVIVMGKITMLLLVDSTVVIAMLFVVVYIIVVVIGKITMVLLVTYCSPGKYPPPPSSL